MSLIQIRRGAQAKVDALVLAPGELAVALDTGNVYIGTEAGKIHINPTGGTADTALKLQIPREFSVAGDATAPAVSFDGTQDVQLLLTLANIASLAPGTYTKVTVDQKGRVTAGHTIEVTDLPSLPSSKITGLGTAATANTGTGQGNVPVIQADGKLLASLLPDLSGTYVPIGTTINGKPLSGSVTLGAADVGAIPNTLLGAAGGVAQLDGSGKVPATQLPSYVDDVLEFDTQDGFPPEGEAGKIYVAKDTNLTYRWSGSQYVEISPSLALGETSSTAFPGDKGKTAYDHAKLTGANPHGTTAAQVGAAPASHTMAAASDSQLGHIKAGNGFSVGGDGTLSLDHIDGGTF